MGPTIENTYTTTYPLTSTSTDFNCVEGGLEGAWSNYHKYVDELVAYLYVSEKGEEPRENGFIKRHKNG